MLAFTNYFYVINSTDKYMERQWGDSDPNITFLDSLLTTYFIGLGDFSTGGFNNGNASPEVWFFFIFASFMMLIVFMNLLITIIGNKFDEVIQV
jgi:hypothetical protein